MSYSSGTNLNVNSVDRSNLTDCRYSIGNATNDRGARSFRSSCPPTDSHPPGGHPAAVSVRPVIDVARRRGYLFPVRPAYILFLHHSRRGFQATTVVSNQRVDRVRRASDLLVGNCERVQQVATGYILPAVTSHTVLNLYRFFCRQAQIVR